MNSHHLYTIFREMILETDNIDDVKDLSIIIMDIMCNNLNDSLAKSVWKEFMEDDMVDARYGH